MVRDSGSQFTPGQQQGPVHPAAFMAGAPERSFQKLPDLADHFMTCAKSGRYLTVYDNSRYLITDDFRAKVKIGAVPTAVASVMSKDPLVAQAALLPLSRKAIGQGLKQRDKWAELFELIEDQAFNKVIRETAHVMVQSDFREAHLVALEAALGEIMTPARFRYRAFLDIVRQLAEKKISSQTFRDEFMAFTHDVAGKLDFGIYSFAIDRIFQNSKVPEKAKRLLVKELLNFPPLIRRELITNILIAPTTDRGFAEDIRHAAHAALSIEAATEIHLLEALKLKRLSLDEIETSLLARL